MLLIIPSILDDKENVVALSGMGNCHLTLANYWLGKVDTLDEEESDTKTELKEEETKAAEQLKKGKTEPRFGCMRMAMGV
jgi:hypothetical protein